MLLSKKTIILAIVLTGVFVSSAFAANRDVCPSGCAYSSIQAAINAASDGDTIRVAQGIYFENIDIDDSINITIEGGWDSTFTNISYDPSLTVVNGMGLDHVFYIRASTDESISVTIKRLTITNGFEEDGGGIYVYSYAGSSSTTDSSVNLTIRNCHIVGNRAYDNGGGIYVYSSTYSDTGRSAVNLKLKNNRISENSACEIGGGIYIYGYGSSSYTQMPLIIFDIDGNEINGNYAASYGGVRIYLDRVEYEDTGSSSVIQANEINGNEASKSIGGLYVDLRNCTSGTIGIVNNVISGNYARDDSAGGIEIKTYLSDAVFDITNNTITANNGYELRAYSEGSGGVPDNLVLNLYNNIIYANDSGWLASEEIYLYNYSDGNMVVNLGSNILSTVDVNSVIYNDMGGNLATDPLIGDDFHLCAGSPAIDSADASEAPATDHDGHVRVAAPLPDRGAYEYLGSDHQAELPVPYEPFQMEYPSIPKPVVASDEVVARPFIVYINETSHTLGGRIALPDFSGAVDVYIGFSIPFVFPGYVFQIANDLSLKPLSVYGPVPWQSGITGAVESSLLGDLNTNNLPRGEYFIYMIIVPAGQSPMGPTYYYYTTSVIND